MNLKKCSKCGLVKFRSEFHKHTRNPDGLKYHCKQCIAIERKESYPRHREKRLVYNKEWRKRNHEHCLAYNRQWRKNNPEKAKAMDMRNQMPNKEIRKYMRKTVLGAGGGKTIRRVIKRDYTDHCELCGITNKKLVYHHWDDTDLQEGKRIKGIWICTYCHILVEAHEQGRLWWRLEEYIELKNEITEEIEAHSIIKLAKEE